VFSRGQKWNEIQYLCFSIVKGASHSAPTRTCMRTEDTVLTLCIILAGKQAGSSALMGVGGCAVTVVTSSECELNYRPYIY